MPPNVLRNVIEVTLTVVHQHLNFFDLVVDARLSINFILVLNHEIFLANIFYSLDHRCIILFLQLRITTLII